VEIILFLNIVVNGSSSIAKIRCDREMKGIRFVQIPEPLIVRECLKPVCQLPPEGSEFFRGVDIRIHNIRVVEGIEATDDKGHNIIL